MTLRVVHVVRQYHPSRGGMEDVVCNIARMQQSMYGHRPRVVTLDRVFREEGTLPHAQVLDGIPVQRLSWRGSERYPLYPAVLACIKDADVVHVHGVDFAFDFLSAMRWWHRKPMVASTHGGFFHTGFMMRAKRVFFHTVTRFTARGYRRIIASSASDGAIFREIVSPERLRVIENGADLEKFAQASSPVLVPTLMYLGRWSSNKGLPATLALLRALRLHDPRWQLIVAGREYDLDAAAVMNLAQSDGVSDAVTLLPNPDNDAIRAAMGRASYFVCLSAHEGFGLAAVEAMSAGLVPVLSAIAPFERLAAQSGIAQIVPGDPDDAARIVLALHDRLKTEHTTMRRDAQAAVQEYSWRSVVGAYVEEYERAVNPDLPAMAVPT